MTDTSDTVVFPSNAAYKYTRAACTTYAGVGTITVTMVEA